MKIKIGNISILLCVLASIFIVLKMYTGSNLFLWIFLIITCGGMLFAREDYRIEYLLFFISWVYVIKFEFSQLSLFVFLSLFYIFLNVISLLLRQRKISYILFLSFFLFSFYVLTVSLLSGGNFNETIGFLLNFSVVFIAIIVMKKETHLRRYLFIYSLGLLLSIGIRFLSYAIPNINSYIENMTRINTVYVSGNLNIRFAGLDLDPNYFALQVLFSVSCLLVYIFYDRKVDKKVILMMIFLIIGGILSFSKMFIISLVFLLLITLFVFFRNSPKLAVGYALSMFLIVGVGLYFFYDFLFNIYGSRFFGNGVSVNAITTGRSEKWILFISEILNNLKIFLFGAGYGTEVSNGTIAHNMYISTFYYMGLIGICVTLIYFYNLFRRLKINIGDVGKVKTKVISVNMIPLCIFLIPNLSLDSFLMDYFPYYLLLIMITLSINKSENLNLKV